jgi:hypothetical protein
MTEDTLAYLLGSYFSLTQDTANALYGLLGNRSRIDLLLYMAQKKEKDPDMLDKVKHLCKCFDICRENRNIVAHSSVRLLKPSEPIDIFKRSASTLGAFVSFGYDLAEIRRVLAEIETLFGFATLLTTVHLWNGNADIAESLGDPPRPRVSLPGKPPLPRKLTPIPPNPKGAPPPPES